MQERCAHAIAHVLTDAVGLLHVQARRKLIEDFTEEAFARTGRSLLQSKPRVQGHPAGCAVPPR